MDWCDLCGCDIFDDEDMYVTWITDMEGDMIRIYMCEDCYYLT